MNEAQRQFAKSVIHKRLQRAHDDSFFDQAELHTITILRTAVAF